MQHLFARGSGARARADTERGHLRKGETESSRREGSELGLARNEQQPPRGWRSLLFSLSAPVPKEPDAARRRPQRPHLAGPDDQTYKVPRRGTGAPQQAPRWPRRTYLTRYRLLGAPPRQPLIEAPRRAATCARARRRAAVREGLELGGGYSTIICCSGVRPVDVEGPAPGILADQPDGVRLNDVPGKPGTLLGLGLRTVQFICSAIALASMASTNFASVPAYRFLVAMAALNTLWSLPLALADLYSLAVKRRLRDHRLDRVLTIGDGILGLLLFMAATASGGISYRFNEADWCGVHNCAILDTSTIFALISFFALSPCFYLNLSSWPS